MNAANHSSTSISVTWKSIPQEHRRGRIKEYTVTVTEVETGSFTRTTEANWGNNSIKILGLKKYTLYNVTVSASTSKGASSESKVYQIRTAEDGKVIINMIIANHHYHNHHHHYHHHHHHQHDHRRHHPHHYHHHHRHH